jgi:CelD/BcsL family acetyltransferase involved in cellulose biosynthesis
MSSSGSSYEFERLAGDDELARLDPEWLELFERSGTRNPFAHPGWVRAWLRAFVPDPSDRVVVTARRDGELHAVAPFYRRRYRIGPLQAECLQLAGASPTQDDPLTEMSEILVPRGNARRSLRTVLNHVLAEHGSDFDWLGVSLPPHQCWFDDEWVPEAWQRRGAYAVH